MEVYFLKTFQSYYQRASNPSLFWSDFIPITTETLHQEILFGGHFLQLPIVSLGSIQASKTLGTS